MTRNSTVPRAMFFDLEPGVSIIRPKATANYKRTGH
jgi:hypothetical protein